MTNQAIPAWAVPGARVVCIDGSDHDPDRPLVAVSLPIKQAVYTLAYVAEGSLGHDPGFVLVELPNKSPIWGEVGWRINRFRPAVEPKSLEEDTALFEDIVRGMSLVERLDRIAETLDA